MIFLELFVIYTIQMILACFFNAWNATRIPKNGVDFLKLTFLPYAILYRKEIKYRALS